MGMETQEEESALETQELEEKMVPKELIDLIISDYENAIDKRMEILHSRFEVFISEAKLPIIQVIAVLQLLLAEAIDMAKRKYLGE